MNPASPFSLRKIKSLGQPRLVCLLLCLLAWRGPVPMVHSHQVGLEGRTASEHLDRYHEADVETPLQWHFHVMLWQDISPACPTEQPPAPESLVAGGPGFGGAFAAASLLPASEATAWVSLPWNEAVRGGGQVAPCGPSSFTNFLSSQLLARPACAVLSVSRC
jgi:hypothetical protein